MCIRDRRSLNQQNAEALIHPRRPSISAILVPAVLMCLLCCQRDSEATKSSALPFKNVSLWPDCATTCPNEMQWVRLTKHPWQEGTPLSTMMFYEFSAALDFFHFCSVILQKPSCQGEVMSYSDIYPEFLTPRGLLVSLFIVLFISEVVFSFSHFNNFL